MATRRTREPIGFLSESAVRLSHRWRRRSSAPRTVESHALVGLRRSHHTERRRSVRADVGAAPVRRLVVGASGVTCSASMWLRVVGPKRNVLLPLRGGAAGAPAAGPRPSWSGPCGARFDEAKRL
jgi:hypothetical protein